LIDRQLVTLVDQKEKITSFILVVLLSDIVAKFWRWT